ncbi:hypothetical protein JVX98_07635 (plasmid) [Ensifer sp. PDNC004]|uniref:hypothetical protein n=1 Tax=Ensifer sp. PDNC004 TaxID=2811423 RepID=UPI0019630FF6|nr:hypothetical protein [Ensifer sp. PDNC004]QRY65489.1 hypothetical protein JVX98_07635 [Ensifer sp. PDNC004]
MDIGVVVWADDLKYISARLAIDNIARVHHRRGFKIKLLCLHGYELFKQTSAGRFGYEIIDCEPFFSDLEKKYVGIRRIFSHDTRGGFFFKNTMRWFVLNEFLTGKKLSVDGDIVINSGATDALERSRCDFYYPDSTCFVQISDDFMNSYTSIVDLLNTDAVAGLEHIKAVSRKHDIRHWGLSSINSTLDLDEEKIAAFAVHSAGLYRIPAGKRPELASPPFIAHAWGNPPLGRYLESEFHRFRDGVRYSFSNDTHYFSEYPLAFMHYQEQLHYVIGCHRLLRELTAHDDVYRNLLTKDKVYRFLNGELPDTKYPAFIRLLHDVSHNPDRTKVNHWDMRDIITECEQYGMGLLFSRERWHSPSMFAD